MRGEDGLEGCITVLGIIDGSMPRGGRVVCPRILTLGDNHGSLTSSHDEHDQLGG
jgi:hypothetical protein